MHTCVQHLYMCPSICYFSRLKQLLLSEPVLTLLCHSSMSAVVSLKRIAEAESLRYNNETNAKRENWWKEWIKGGDVLWITNTMWMQMPCTTYIIWWGFSLVIKLFPLLESCLFPKNIFHYKLIYKHDYFKSIRYWLSSHAIHPGFFFRQNLHREGLLYAGGYSYDKDF